MFQWPITGLLCATLFILGHCSPTGQSNSVRHLRLDFNGRARYIPALTHRMPVSCKERFDDGSYTELQWITPQGVRVGYNKTATVYAQSLPEGLFLVFSSQTPAQSGRYTCKAHYIRKLWVKTSIEIVVVPRLSSDECPGVQELITGKNGIIRCGGPKDKILSVYGQYNFLRFVTQDNEAHIHSVVPSDAGNYNFTVKHRHVEYDYYITVNVRDPPDTTSPIVIAVAILAVVIAVIVIDAVRFYPSRKGVLYSIRHIDMNGMFQMAANDGHNASEQETKRVQQY